MFETLVLIALASLWPALSILRNVPLGINPLGPLAASAATFLIACVVWATLRLAGVSRSRATALCSAGIVALFSFGILRGPVVSYFGDAYFLALRVALAIWALLSLVLLLGAWILAPRPIGRTSMAVALVTAVGAGAVETAWRLFFSVTQDATISSADASEGHTAGRSNVYYLLLDGYGRSDQLSAHLNFDNEIFLSALRQRGFVIQEKARSNYLRTDFSVPHTLLMDYAIVDQESLDLQKKSIGPISASSRGHNPVYRRFSDLGYSHVQAGMGCYGVEDICLSRKPIVPNEVVAMLHMTPLPLLLWRVSPEFAAGLLFEGAETAWLPDVAKTIETMKGQLFVFAHLLLPHDTIYHADCTLRDDAADLATAAWEQPDRIALKRDAYISTTECINSQTLEFIDSVLGHDPEAIIVVTADHGFSFGLDWSAPVEEWSMAQIVARSSILAAWRLPQRCRKWLYPNMTPINHFRLIFACVEDGEPTFIRDTTYVTNYGSRARIREVTTEEFEAYERGLR